MKIFFRKIPIIFDIEKWLLKSEFCNFAGLITWTENVQKKFQCNFCDQWSISFSLKSFYQIPLTWSKTYIWQILQYYFACVKTNQWNLLEPRTCCIAVIKDCEEAIKNHSFTWIIESFKPIMYYCWKKTNT